MSTSDPLCDDPALVMARASKAQRERDEAEERRRQARLAEFEEAFRSVRWTLPDEADDRASALEHARRWVYLSRVLDQSRDLIKRPLAEIDAEPHSEKDYALRFVRTALIDETQAADMLLKSWNTCKQFHANVVYWLTGGLEAEIKGTSIWGEPPASIEPAPSESVEAMQKIREAFQRKPCLCTAKTATIINEVCVRRKDGLAVLRELKSSGEYRPG